MDRALQVLNSNKAQFEYDIHALVKAFYPAWELKILTPESVVKDRKVRETVPVMELEFSETEVKFTIYNGLHHVENVYLWQNTDLVEPSEYKDHFKHLYRKRQAGYFPGGI